MVIAFRDMMLPTLNTGEHVGPEGIRLIKYAESNEYSIICLGESLGIASVYVRIHEILDCR